jgi:CheY-like chemotaxis protein
VLVVDDEPEILALLDEVLGREGYAVEVAASGREALARIDGRAFDLIISDVRMPDVDGRELYRLLRAGRPDLADRVLFLTGDTLGLTLADLPGLDPEALLEKPVTPAAIREAVRRHLRIAPTPENN